MSQPSITCPRCGRTSYNPNDIAEGYCGACHWWTSDALLGRVVVPSPDEIVFRPGPDHIEPSSAPGGVVVHVYGRDGRRLLERTLCDLDDIDNASTDAFEVELLLAPGESMCIVVYDGDTGVRVPGAALSDILGPSNN